ncbi:MAG TPA: hypothetical protein VHA54_00865 [Solirubrobacterales bacterium]|nr:hypothetical protein [Solirubrobacterales bacterium]
MKADGNGNGRRGAAVRPPLAALWALAAVGLFAALAASTAAAAVGVEGASRRGGSPGEEVRLTLGCGFCFPPCVGPKGERHPEGFDHGPCMLGTHRPPPRSFGVSLVPLAKAPRPHPCGPNALCEPVYPGPPRRQPFTYLGLAVPPPGGNNPEHGDPPRYRLSFAIPDLPPGPYAYAIWCDSCQPGAGGSLISVPASRRWRLTVR